jgi:hypothetical protein
MSGPETKSSSGSHLPPPPAPTARDANPWPMPGQRAARPISWPRGPKTAPTSVVAEPRAAEPGMPPIGRKASPLRWLPFAIIVGLLVAVGSSALQSFRQGDFIGALLPLVVVGIIASGWWRSLRRDRR